MSEKDIDNSENKQNLLSQSNQTVMGCKAYTKGQLLKQAIPSNLLSFL